MQESRAIMIKRNMNLFDRVHSFTASGAFFLCTREHAGNSTRGPCLRTNQEGHIREKFNLSNVVSKPDQKHLPAQELISQPVLQLCGKKSSKTD